MARHPDRRGTTLMEPPRPERHVPSRGPTTPHRMRSFWPLMALIVGGTLLLLLVVYAVVGISTTEAPVDEVTGTTGTAEFAPAYTGDWKDLVAQPRTGTTGAGAAGSAPAYTGDWKDLIAQPGTGTTGAGAAGSAPAYTGDWKDLIGGNTA